MFFIGVKNISLYIEKLSYYFSNVKLSVSVHRLMIICLKQKQKSLAYEQGFLRLGL